MSPPDLGAGTTYAPAVHVQAGVADIGVPTASGYAEGTRIATTRGQVRIEALRPGDLIVNPWNEHLPVHRLGQRHVDFRRHPELHDAWPVRVWAHAFGPGLPMRDVVLAPDHTLYVDDLLVPVHCLVNGTTVAQEQADSITWWQVELERHDVLLAERLPAESYLDTGNRSAFADGGPAVTPDPDFAREAWETSACGWLATTGPAVAAIRARLLARAQLLGHAAA